MKLLVHELETTLTQTILVGPRALQLYAIRPHLYKHGAPAGNLKIHIKDTFGNVVDISETIQISSLPSATYFHGHIRFLIQTRLKDNTPYKVVLVAGGGYSFSESAYIGWCNDFDLRVVQPAYTPAGDSEAALSMQLWELKTVQKGSS